MMRTPATRSRKIPRLDDERECCDQRNGAEEHAVFEDQPADQLGYGVAPQNHAKPAEQGDGGRQRDAGGRKEASREGSQG